MSLESREEAKRVAQQVIKRAAQSATIIENLRNKGTLGLECLEAIQLDNLLEENAASAQLLAQWILREPPARLRPRISLILDRPDSPPYNIEIGGLRVTPPMLDAAEDLLHTLMTGEREPPRGLYELCATAFGTTREDAKKRILAAMFSKKSAPVSLPPEEPST